MAVLRGQTHTHIHTAGRRFMHRPSERQTGPGESMDRHRKWRRHMVVRHLPAAPTSVNSGRPTRREVHLHNDEKQGECRYADTGVH